ncbi:phage portal protein [Arthrobacter sp. RCC_34]|uniref:phage portal protein n=1 Tax=Arthrobacter sp. RCC_34 TaxID=3239230 RepID=UPI003523600C
MTWGYKDLSNLTVEGLTDDELRTTRKLFATWAARLPKTLRRSQYADAENPFKDLGIALPPQLRNAKFYLSWAAMAVRRPSLRVQFDGLHLPGSDDPFELGEVFKANNFGLEFQQAVTGANKHSVSFVTVAKGDKGEAPAQIIGHSAETSAGIWNRRKRRLEALLTITDVDQRSNPTEFIVWLDDFVITCTLDGAKWTAQKDENPIGRVLGVPVRNDPQGNAPFGRSRLTNSVMALNDMAVRAFVRMEGNAEFYSTPQLAILGIAEDAFSGSVEEAKFKLAMSRLLALTKDEDGDIPQLKQLQQATMTPHSDMLRTVAMAFSGETGLSPSSLGVLHDQPSSAEAIRAAEHELLIDIMWQNQYVLAPAVEEIAGLAYMVKENETSLPDEFWKLSARFRNPEFRSMSAEADALTKLAPVLPQLIQYPTLAGRVFTDDEVDSLRNEAKQGMVADFINRVAGQTAVTPEVAAEVAKGADNQATA